MGTVGGHAATALALLCLGQGQAAAQAKPPVVDDAAEPGVTSQPSTGSAPNARGTVPIRVAYTAHDECPDSNAFLTRLLERTAQARVADPGEVARTLVVTIRRDGTASSGQISLADRNGVTSTREVAASSCDQVVTALALVASVCIAEGAADSRSAAPSSTPTEPRPAQTEASPDAPPPTTPSPTGDANRTPRPPPPSDAPAAAKAVAVAAGANAEITSAYDKLSLALRLFGELGLGLGPLHDATLRLSLLYATNSAHVDESDANFGGSDADFSWWLARVGVCPLGLGAALKLRPCVGVEGGLVHTESTYVATGTPKPPTSKLQPWVAGLGFLRLQVRVFDAVWLEADGGVSVPFTRYRFSFVRSGTPDPPERTVREVPAAGAFGAIGFGVGLL